MCMMGIGLYYPWENMLIFKLMGPELTHPNFSYMGGCCHSSIHETSFLIPLIFQ